MIYGPCARCIHIQILYTHADERTHMHASTYTHAFQVDDTQQGVDHVRKQDEHGGESLECMLSI